VATLPRLAPKGGPISGRTTAVERWLHHVSSALVLLSGVAYGWMKYLVEPDPESFSIVNHPWQPQALHLHVLAAPLFVLAVGMLLRMHVPTRWRSGARANGRRSGLSLLFVLAPMILSGYLLQVNTHEGLGKFLIVLHLVSSAVWAIAWGVHVFIARWRTA
jgi:hypothetical protein